MSDVVDPRLRAALRLQLEGRRAALAAGAERVGWKLGVGERERIGSGPVVGHLTSATLLAPGDVVRAADAGDLHADAEVAVRLGADVGAGATRAAVLEAIDGFAAALELVDLEVPREDPQAIVAANVFHRAVAFGPLSESAPQGDGRLVVNGETRAAAEIDADAAGLVQAAATVLATAGEQPRAGDWLILGAVVQVPVRPGDEVVADLDALGRVTLSIAG